MISHHHKCIFIHIPKTAGQSIEHCFIRSLGLTWETRAPLLLRYNDRPELGPPSLAHLKYSEYSEYKYITEEQIQTYFKFAFIRNPWSRLVSIYKYMGQWFFFFFFKKKNIFIFNLNLMNLRFLLIQNQLYCLQ